MKKLLGLLLAFVPMVAVAQSGIDGTWRIDLAKSQMDTKPMVITLKDGMYNCSCDPNVTAKADGQEHKVTGSPYADTMRISQVNDNTVKVVGMKDGKHVFQSTMTVAPDNKSMTENMEFHPAGNNQVVTFNTNYARVGEAEAGTNALSGSWERKQIASASDNGLTFTYALTGDGVNYKQKDGEFYSAKFDGKDYPYHGDPSITTVQVRKIDDHTFEEIDKNNGKVIYESRISIAPDGKSLDLAMENKLTGTTNKFVADKQESQEAGK